jgi:hypothetical protein
MTERERIARVVDPEAFAKLDALVVEREGGRLALMVWEISEIVGPALAKADVILARPEPSEAAMKADLIEAVRTASGKPYLSERECLAIVRGVLGVVREPTRGAVSAMADKGWIEAHANTAETRRRIVLARARLGFTAMIDALLVEVGE